jgi:hypothetical protein
VNVTHRGYFQTDHLHKITPLEPKVKEKSFQIRFDSSRNRSFGIGSVETVK